MSAQRTIAIGDIHGCARALAALLEAIGPQRHDTLVFLGDYIDRGPDSRGVLEQIIALGAHCRVVALLGNHEEMLLAALEGADELRYWLKFGGVATLASYGYTGQLDLGPRQLRGVIATEHLLWLRRCGDYFETLRHFFVHGYYEPDVALHDQCWTAMRWVALPASPEPHYGGKVAIVGHTEVESGEVLDVGFLKCIDTFCHGGGWLTALEVNTGRVWQACKLGRLRGIS